MRKLLAVLLLALFAAAPVRAAYTQAELDQMLAPVALYPDALLSQVLMASTYPLDIVEAARWTRAHPGLQGDEAVGRVAGEDWDPSVKSLVAFPGLLQRMDENLPWTRSLGAAFLEQEPHVMETVQRLRRKAQAAGHLLPDERLRAVADGNTIILESADPRIVYVPYYDPWIVYGAWGWPAYPPVAWTPWTQVAIGVTAGFFFGGIDWHHRHVTVVHVDNHYVRPLRSQPIRSLHIGKWQHVPRHRREYQRRHERTADFVAQPRRMPPALSASPPARRVQQPRRVEAPRMQAQPQVQPRRGDAPRNQAQPQMQPRRIEAPRVEPRPRAASPPATREVRPIFRAEPQGRDGGWRGRSRDGAGHRRTERNGPRG